MSLANNFVNELFPLEIAVEVIHAVTINYKYSKYIFYCRS